MNKYHETVLLNETIDILQVQQGKKYIDATVGGGGHTESILRLGGTVLGIDQDTDAIDYTEKTLSGYVESNKLIVCKGNFSDILGIAKEKEFTSVAGILYDLGASGHQFEVAERGFSFQRDGPLDMRMDREMNVKAQDLINILTKGELYELFHKLGEERFARSIAERIVSARRLKPVTTTTELEGIIRKTIPRIPNGVNPATRIFQALRIAVNDELNALRSSLPMALSLLETKGRIAAIAFHSLEDRIVKKQFRDWEDKHFGHALTKKPVTPGSSELTKNNRSRSAKLRGFEKI